MKTLRPFLEFDYATEGSFAIHFDFRPKNDYRPLSLEIHLFGRSIWLGIRHKGGSHDYYVDFIEVPE